MPWARSCGANCGISLTDQLTTDNSLMMIDLAWISLAALCW